MSNMITVPWTPRAKQRPRFNRKTGSTYTPAETKKAEAAIRAAYLQVNDALVEVEGPIAVKLELHDDHFNIEIIPTVEYVGKKLKGDIDNYSKTVLDALNGVAWVDDRQITHLNVKKGS